jgi:hypothetical protein
MPFEIYYLVNGTYLIEESKEAGVLAYAFELVIDQQALDGLASVAAGLARIFQIDLFQQLADEVLVEIVSELGGQLKGW